MRQVSTKRARAASAAFPVIGGLLAIILGLAVIAGGLLYAAVAVDRVPVPEASAGGKIGPTLTVREAMPRPAPAPPASAAEPAQNTPPAEAPIVLTSPLGVAPIIADPGPPLLTPAPASPATGANAAPRQASGSRGCTGYRSYNPQTGTYRAFDGTIRECRPEN